MSKRLRIVRKIDLVCMPEPYPVPPNGGKKPLNDRLTDVMAESLSRSVFPVEVVGTLGVELEQNGDVTRIILPNTITLVTDMSDSGSIALRGSHSTLSVLDAMGTPIEGDVIGLFFRFEDPVLSRMFTHEGDGWVRMDSNTCHIHRGDTVTIRPEMRIALE